MGFIMFVLVDHGNMEREGLYGIVHRGHVLEMFQYCHVVVVEVMGVCMGDGRGVGAHECQLRYNLKM